MKPGHRKLLPLALIGGGEPVENLLEMTADNVVLGKYINNSGQVQGSDLNFYYSQAIAVGPKDTINLSCSVSLNYVSIMEYDSDGNFIKRTLYGGTGANAVGKHLTHQIGATTATILWGSNPDGQKVTSAVLGWKWVMTRTINNLFDLANIVEGKYLSTSMQLSDAKMMIVPTLQIPEGYYDISFVVGVTNPSRARRTVQFSAEGSRYGNGTQIDVFDSPGALFEYQRQFLGYGNVMLKFSTSIYDTMLCIVPHTGD